MLAGWRSAHLTERRSEIIKWDCLGLHGDERHFGAILEELNAGFDAARVLQKELCERLKNAHEDKAEVIQLIPRHPTTECTVEQVVDVPAPEAHEDKVEVTWLDLLVPQNHSSECTVGEPVGVPFVPLREDKVEEIPLA